ncbi:MAG: lysyl endopeptidase, partial [Bacteroidota bacterium]
MLKKCYLLLVASVLFVQGSVLAQISTSITPKSFELTNLIEKSALPQKQMPSFDKMAVEEEDLEDEAAGLPPRFGYPFEVNYNLKNSGLWEDLDNGDRIWRLTIRAKAAKSINLLYNDFFIPKGAHLHIYNGDKQQIIGAFTSINNKVDGKFATGLVYGEESTLEYYEPAEVRGEGQINVGTVIHGYRYIPDPKSMMSSYNSSGSCNINTICSEGDDWRDEIKAVGLMLIGGSRWCSGALYGNATGDC